MPRETQGRILRVLVEQRFRRVGGDQDVQVDVRVISSTSRDLREEIAAGRFREDLFHRLNVVPVSVPGLVRAARGHPRTDRRLHRPHLRGLGPAAPPAVADDALAMLQVRAWPGNLRQLRNNVERMLILASGDAVRADHRRHAAAGGRRRPTRRTSLGAERIIALPLREAREVFEREYLNAQMLRFSRQHLAHGRLHRHGALGAAPQAEVAGRLRRPGAGSRRGRELMSRIAYVNGRFAPHGRGRGAHRGSRLPVRRRVYEVWAVFDGKLADAEGHFARLERSLSRAVASPCR